MTGWLVLSGLVAAAGGGARWWWVTHPRVRCRWCRGTGKNPLSTKWREGRCKHCGGSGRHDTSKKK